MGTRDLTNGGESGIRTRDTLLEYTHFPGVRLKPLGHLSMLKVRFPVTFSYVTQTCLHPTVA